jgi:hypothetical protein
MACVEMMQCISQGLNISARKGSTKGGDVAAPLLQLPHMDQDALKKLRKQKINTLKGMALCLGGPGGPAGSSRQGYI